MERITVLFLFLFFGIIIPGFAQKSKELKRAEDLKETASDFYYDGSYDSAIHYYSKASTLFKQHQEWGDYYYVLNKIGRSLFYNEKDPEVMVHQKKILEEMVQTGYTKGFEKADAYNILSMVAIVPEEIINYSKLAIDEFEKIKSEVEDEGDLEYLYYELSFLYKNLHEYNKSIENLDESLKINRGQGEEMNSTIRDVLVEMTEVYFLDQKQVKAEEKINEILGYYQKNNLEQTEDYGRANYQIGMVYYDMGMMDGALDYFIVAYNNYVKTDPDDLMRLGVQLNMIGNCYMDLGKLDKALDYFKQSLKVHMTRAGEIDLEVAGENMNIGIIYDYKGDYKNALKHYNIALKIQLITQGEIDFEVADSYSNIGNIYYFIGNTEEALKHYEKSLWIYQQTIGDSNPRITSCYEGLADVYLDRGDKEKAYEYYKKSLKIKLAELPKDHPDLSYSYNSMSEYFLEFDYFDSAYYYQKTATDIRLNSVGEKHPNMYLEYLDLADILILQKKYEEAGKYLNLTQANLDENNRKEDHYVEYYSTKADYEYLTGDIAEAADFYLKSNNLYIKKMNTLFQYLGERDREKLYSTFVDVFSSFQYFILKNHENYPTLLGNLYDHQLETKSILLNTSNQIKNQIMESGDRVLIDLYEEVQNLKQDIGVFSNMEEEEREEMGIDLDSLIYKMNQKDNLISEYASFYEEGNKKVSWRDIQATLQKGEAAVEIIRVRDYDFALGEFGEQVYYAALIVTPKTRENPELVIIENGKELEDKFIKGYRNSMQLQLTESESYENFWGDIAPKLKGIDKVYLSPDGVYNTLNPETFYNPKSKKFLIDELEIHRVTNTRDLLSVKKPPLKLKFAILMGNPDFGNDGPILKERGQLTLAAVTRSGLAPLPGTEKEVNLITELLEEQNWRTETWINSDATEEKLKKMLKPRVLHIATHGFFEEDKDSLNFKNNPLNRSGLLLTGSAKYLQDPDSFMGEANKEDGILTAYEAMNLNIENTDLVILSACETGLGEVRNGEGVYGLQRSFMVAGARNLLVSLWKVDDKVTQELMLSFYKNWFNGLTKREAFKAAISQIKNEYPDPYYWGAFILIGD